MLISICLALLVSGKPQTRTPEKADAAVTRVSVEAIVLTNEDDQLPAQITPEQVKAWIADANVIYKPAKIQFDFTGDDSDFKAIKNTALNQVVDASGVDFAAAARAGNALAAKYPDKMTVIFRHGPGLIPINTGTGSIERDFVLLPQFDQTMICNHQNIHYMAREIGEYLGIKPTAAQNFLNPLEAENFLHAHKDDPNCFDGDGIKDTPPDPFIVTIEGRCQPTATVMIGDTDFMPPVDNLMSDYDSTKTLSKMQTQWVQWAMRTRRKSGMGTPTNIAAAPPYKIDKLKIASKIDCETSLQTLTVWNAARWNNSSQLLCAAKKGGSLTLSLTVSEDGEYRFDLYAAQAPDFSIIKFYLDDKPIGAAFDGWAPYVMPSGKIELGQAQLKKGPHRIRFEAADKYELSTDYHFGLDSLNVQPVEK